MSEARVPSFRWAQDKKHVYVSIEVVDCDLHKADVQTSSLSFEGSDRNGIKFALDIHLRCEVDAVKSKYSTHRNVEFILEKASDEWWPHLLTKEDKAKYRQRCHVDFDKWIDEDEADEQSMFGAHDFSKFQGLPGGMGGMDMAGMGGMGGGGMEALLSQMGNMGKEGFAMADENEDSDDDEELPELDV
ncbi:MAG: hypothetical protein MHM6MM_001010 [Cercozoa sp. M6MM]